MLGMHCCQDPAKKTRPSFGPRTDTVLRSRLRLCSLAWGYSGVLLHHGLFYQQKKKKSDLNLSTQQSGSTSREGPHLGLPGHGSYNGDVTVEFLFFLKKKRQAKVEKG